MWFEAPPPIDHPYQVMQGVIEWRKVKSRLESMGVRAARDDRQLLLSVKALLGGNSKTRGIMEHLGKHYGTKLRWDQLVDRVQDDAPVWASERAGASKRRTPKKPEATAIW